MSAHDTCAVNGRSIVTDLPLPEPAREGKVNAMFAITRSAIAVLMVAAFVRAHEAAPQRSAAPTPADATARIVTAARALLAALDDAGRAKVQYAFTDDAQRKRWSNFPS